MSSGSKKATQPLVTLTEGSDKAVCGRDFGFVRGKVKISVWHLCWDPLPSCLSVVAAPTPSAGISVVP